jgi:hypothetical protein
VDANQALLIMTTSFLFWNLARKPLRQCVATLAATHGADVVMLAECEEDPLQVLQALNAVCSARAYNFPASYGDRIRIFTTFPKTQLRDDFNDSAMDRLTIRRLRVGRPPGILLAAIHFQDRRNWSREAQALEATVVARHIAEREDRAGHRRTVLVGDLNMNPYEIGVLGTQALNAVMTRHLAARIDRTVAGRSNRCFYNPMWGLLGDRTPGPSGTFFFGASEPTNCYWHMLDQVLLRPVLMNGLKDLRILDHDGQDSLVTKHGRPRKSSSHSDHLPLFFQLDLT